MSWRILRAVKQGEGLDGAPLRNLYWVEPRRWLAGEYPGASNEAEARRRIDYLVGLGIDAFLDLTQPGEMAEYQALLPSQVEYDRCPIPDHSIPRVPGDARRAIEIIEDALRRGRRLYVHCRAGIGRTATVIGCALIERGRDPDATLRHLNDLWAQSPRSANWPSIPETPEQLDYLLNWPTLRGEIAAGPAAPAPVETPRVAPQGSGLGALQRLRDRYLGTLLGLALGDALSAPTVTRRRGSFEPVSDLLGGGPFELPRGAWTDDTAMALCLAESLLEASGFDARDQIERYVRWQREGHLSATGRCLGITAGVARALATAQWRRQPFAGSHDPAAMEADPLTRIAPAVLYFFASPETAVRQAAEAARVTCQAPDLLALTRFVAAALHLAVSGRPREALLRPPRELWAGPKISPRMQQFLEELGNPEPPSRSRDGADPFRIATAAFWALESTGDFREGALAAVNLGGDSDAIGALYGQLAGAHYGARSLPAGWRQAVARADLIEDLADRLLAQAMVELGSQA